MGLAQKTSSLRPPRAIPRERESGVRLGTESRSRSAATDAADDLRTIASAVFCAAAGFEVCARRARTKDVTARMTALACEAKALAEDVAARVSGGVRKPSTSERLRWEWLASTAALLDGGAEGRIADEANRHLATAVAASERLVETSSIELVARIVALAASGRAVAGASRATLPSNDIALAP